MKKYEGLDIDYMTVDDFEIGHDFYTWDHINSKVCRWRCTDKGRRCIVAIEIVDGFVTTYNSVTKEKTRSHHNVEEKEAWGLFKGPPYMFVEHLFDENDQETCYRTAEEAAEDDANER